MKRNKLFLVLALILLMIPASTSSFAAKKKITIGFSCPVLSNIFFRNMADFAAKAGKELGAEIIAVDCNMDDAKQLDGIMGLISKGVDGLVIVPNHTAIVPSLLKQTDKAKIPVVFAERYPGFSPQEYTKKYKGTSYIGFVGVDNFLAGYNIAKALYDGGVRKFVAIGGIPGNAVADDRRVGMQKFLKEHTDMKLLQELRNGEVRDDGLKDAENFLSALPGPGFEGLWAYNDESALGAIKAFRNAGVLNKVKISSMDLISEAVDAIKSGEMLFSTGGQWVETSECVVMLYDFINGKKPTTPVLQLALPNVTIANVKQYEDKFVTSVPDYNFKELSQVYNPKAKNTDFKISL